ncbi:aminotransferase class III [Limnochorda pilosa]|uniref:Aminotransferase class III n=2 Tax=Limnochorda pilosa TaxID=1555112 RepID=A0A0K2SHB2_LIMPI|nr:aminotransferase class III [Limnochorda pilosa]
MAVVPRVDDHLFYRDLRRPLREIVRGEGVYLYDTEGRRYLDGCAGSLAANIGHGNRRVAEVLRRQAERVAFTHLSRFTNGPAIELADWIAERAPGDLSRVYFVSGGSEATETALKLARQYFVDRDGPETPRWKVIARRSSYHGNTLGALSMTGHRARRSPYEPLLNAFPHAAPAYCYRCPFGLEPSSCRLRCATDVEETLLREGPETVAAVIAEPVVGAAAGALVPPDGYWQRLREICDRYGVLLIADEVMTGFGRTGRLFAVEHWNVVPDLLVLAKGMSAGYTPIGAVVAREPVWATLRDRSGRFVHGHTYGANPLSCAASLEVQRILEEEGLVERAEAMGRVLLGLLRERLGSHPLVGDVRGLGLMVGVELVADRVTREPFPSSWGVASRAGLAAERRGLVVYPGSGAHEGRGDHVLIGPPFIIDATQVEELADLLEESLNDLAGELAGRNPHPREEGI